MAGEIARTLLDMASLGVASVSCVVGQGCGGAALALIPVFSLAGVPPLSGFVGKVALLRATLEASAYWTSAAILVVGVLTLLSMGRLWEASFWKPAPNPEKAPLNRVILLPIAGLSAATLAITFAAEPLFTLALRAGEQLLRPEAYIEAVLYGGARR